MRACSLPAVALLIVCASTGLCLAADNQPGNATAAAPPPPPGRRRFKAAKGRRPCAENDARCIGLRDHECDPYYQNVTDKCTFVQYNRHCAEDVHHINYLQLFYCRPPGDSRVLVGIGFLIFMGVLFWVMAAVAEDFLVPALEFLAVWMRMAPDVAGVTLFAFASGAPDLFTQIAAVAVGGNVDQELAIGATLGAGLFIIAVILSIVMLAAQPDAAPGAEGGGPAGQGGSAEEITDRRAFVRDAVAYLLSTLALLGLMLRGTFTAWEAGLLLLGYGAYLTVCLLTSRGGVGARQHAYLAVSPSQQQQQQINGHAWGQAVQLAERQEQQEQLGGGAGPRLDGVVVASAVAGGGGADGLPLLSPRAQVELVNRAGGGAGQRKASRTTSLDVPGNPGSRPASPAIGKALDAASAGLAVQQQQEWQQQWQESDGVVRENELAALVAGMPLSDAPPGTAVVAVQAGTPAASPRGTLVRPRLRRTGSGRGGLAGFVDSATLGLEELLHTKGKSGPRLWATVAMAPLMLLLHLSMPALHAGCYTPWYAAMLSLTAPLFTLLSTGLYPHHLSTPYFVLTWLLAALLLYALLLAVPPANSQGSAVGGTAAAGAAPAGGSAATSPLSVAAAGSPFNGSAHGGRALPGTVARLARLSPVPGSASAAGSSGGPLWARAWAVCGWQIRRPRRNVLLAVFSSVQCMLWMSLAADELVALFQAIGRIMDLSQDLLGATVLAWGEAVPELVATLSLARSGQATMAIAAVFGGPIFNILIAWAAPTLYAALRRHGPLPYRLSPGVGVLVLFTVLVLAFLLLAVPLVFRWRLSRSAAVAVLAIYGLSQLLFLLAEGL